MKLFVQRICICLFIAGVSLGVRAEADRLVLKEMPANTRWLLHFDLQRWLSSPWLSAFSTSGEVPGLPDGMMNRIEKFQTDSSINITSDLQSVTVFGTGDENAVFHLRGRWDPDRLSAIASGQPGVIRERWGDYELLSWPGGGPGKGPERLYGCFARPDLMIIGTSLPGIGAALEAQQAQDANLAGNGTLSRMSDRTSQAFLRILALDGTKIATNMHQAALLHQSDRLSFAIEPEAEDLAIKLDIDAISEQAAADMLRMIGGIQAMLTMRANAEPQLARLAQSLRVRSQGRQFNASLKLDPETLAFLAQQAANVSMSRKR